jgi:hypothetical protein
MKNSSSPHFHGYVNSTLDNAVRVRLTNGQIVALKITSYGIEARLLGRPLGVPEELRQIHNPTHLVEFLKSHQLGLTEEEIVIVQGTNRASPQIIKTSPPISVEDL